MTSAAERRRPGQVVPWASGTASTASADLPRIAPWVLLSSALMPVVLIASWLIADAVQPPAYSPIRQTVSVLSGYAGTERWIVTTGLYAVGIAYLVTAAGMREFALAARTGLIVAGAAALGVATFPVPVQGTSHPHAVWVVIGAIAIAVWPALAARQGAVRAAVGPRLSGIAIAVSAGLFLWTAVETRDGPLLGLAERVSSALQVSWPFVVVLMVRRAGRPTSRERADSAGSVAQVAR